MSSTNVSPESAGTEETPPARGVIRLLFLGDIVGEPGRRAVIEHVPAFRKQRGVDFVVVNGENAAGGRGITPKIGISLLRAGVSVITSGDHIWDQPEVVDFIENEPRLLRPLNYPGGSPGQGSVVIPTDKGEIGVMNVMGRAFVQPTLDNPFNVIDAEVDRLRERTKVLFVDIHAETTSEKIAMGRMLDGRVSAVVGTHTHVQTADEQIFPGGTAFLCDAGMCGPVVSVLGRSIDPVVRRFRTSLPCRFPVAKGPVSLCGALVDIDADSGRALAIERIAETVA